MKIKVIDRSGNVFWFAGFIVAPVDPSRDYSLSPHAGAAIDVIGAERIVKRYNKGTISHGLHFTLEKKNEQETLSCSVAGI